MRCRMCFPTFLIILSKTPACVTTNHYGLPGLLPVYVFAGFARRKIHPDKVK
jgi:hypothetical protein